MSDSDDLERNIETHQTLTARKLGSISSRFVHLGLSKLIEFLANEWTLIAAEDYISSYKPKKGEEVPTMEDVLATHLELKREVSIEEGANYINEHPEMLSFELMDALISQDWKVRAMVNTALSISGAIMRQHDGWSKELLEKREELLLEMAKAYRPDVYEIFKDRPAILAFFTEYIIHKFGI